MIWIADLIGLIERIPATFWGVVVGSFFTLGGIALTNRAHARALRLQFAHDHDVRVKDRELALRKDIYLEAVEAIHAGLMSVGRFADLNIPDAEITKAFTDKAPAIAKVQIIATEETAKAVFDISAALNAAFLKLVTHRISLNAQKTRLTQLDGQIAQFAKTRDEMLERMRQYNLEGKNDPRRWKVIEDNFNFEANRIAQTIQQKSTIGATLLEEHLKIAEQCFEEIHQLTTTTLPAIFAARKELDLPINESNYTKIVRESTERQKADNDQFLKRLKEFAAAQSKAVADAAQAPTDPEKPRTT